MSPADTPPGGSSYALRQADCHPAAGTDRRSQERVAGRGGRSRLASRIAMLELVGAKFGDIGGEFRVVLPELVELAGIMAINLGFHRIGAGERRFLRHQRGRRAEREAGDVPQRLERRRAHPAFGDQLVEAGEMAFFLRRHARDELGFRTVAAKDRQLPGVDARRAIFAGLVDAQHGCGVRPPVAGPPAGHARLERRLRRRISAAPPSERMAFHPAIEMPRKRNWTSSQRTKGAWVICLSKSAVLAPFAKAVHWVKPSKIFASTPA